MSGKRVLLAAIGGLVSASLFVTSYAFHSPILTWPQAVGFIVSLLLRGRDTATKSDFALIGLPINVVLYAVVAAVFIRIFASKSPNA